MSCSGRDARKLPTSCSGNEEPTHVLFRTRVTNPRPVQKDTRIQPTSCSGGHEEPTHVLFRMRRGTKLRPVQEDTRNQPTSCSGGLEDPTHVLFRTRGSNPRLRRTRGTNPRPVSVRLARARRAGMNIQMSSSLAFTTCLRSPSPPRPSQRWSLGFVEWHVMRSLARAVSSHRAHPGL